MTTVDPRQLALFCAQQMGIPYRDRILRKGRRPAAHVSEARHITAFVLREVWQPQLSLPYIAELVGCDNHTSVIYGTKKVKADFVLKARALKLIELWREREAA